MKIRLLGLVLVLALVLGGGWLWFRDSSLVAVQQVTVTGANGPDAAQIDAALASTARRMTTLDSDTAKLRAAVARFPSVRSVQATTSFPHAMQITIVEEQPVAVLTAGTKRVTVASNGALLREVRPSGSLPTVAVRSISAGSHLTDRDALAIVAVLAAAPYRLLAHVQKATDNASHGVVADLRNGPSVYFGEPGLQRAKWTAAAAVLADPSSSGASYIDVTDPRRPAAGVQ